MANFARVWASGVGDDVPVTGSELTLLDEQTAKAANWSEGSEHTPTSPILLHGVAIQIDTDGSIRIDGAINVYSGGAVNFLNGSSAEVTNAEINYNSGGISNLKSGANWNLLSGAQARAYSGSTFQFDGTQTVTNGATFNFQDGADLQLSGASDYPLTPGHEEWLQCRGDTMLEKSAWNDWYGVDGISWTVQVNEQRRLWFRVPVPAHLTVDTVQVYWDGPGHLTWPPANKTTFNLYRVNCSTGARALITTQADTSVQATYESAHAVVVGTGLGETFGTGEIMMIEMVTESGTDAVAGSKWIGAEMKVTFEELHGI